MKNGCSYSIFYFSFSLENENNGMYMDQPARGSNNIRQENSRMEKVRYEYDRLLKVKLKGNRGRHEHHLSIYAANGTIVRKMRIRSQNSS